MRSDSGTGIGFSRTLWTMEKSAVLAPIHRASVSATVSVNALSFHNSRSPTRISEFIRDCRRKAEGWGSLLNPQSHGEVDVGGAPGGHEVGQRGHRKQDAGGAEPGHRIRGADAVHRARHRPR